jgi:hypothetical protein
MIRWFRRKRPSITVTSQLSLAEAVVIYKSGLTLTEWQALSNHERANIRWRVGA